MLDSRVMRSARWVLSTAVVCGVLCTPAHGAPLDPRTGCFAVLPASATIPVGAVAAQEITNRAAEMTAELDWGDGAAETHAFKAGEKYTYNHAYAAPGVYRLTLTASATYPNGRTCWDTRLLLATITVT
ncbi:MAG TPA: hypothetical protein VGJ70_02140 [Solirubrobacteraceae bacterium]